MKIFFGLLLLFVGLLAAGQNNLTPTDRFTIEGQVKHELNFSIDDLQGFPIKVIPDLMITDHM